MEKAAKSVSGQVLYHEELLETVTYLTEYPTVVCGSYDREYLKTPQRGIDYLDDVSPEILSGGR